MLRRNMEGVSQFKSALIDSFFAACITFMIAAPVLGMRTTFISGEMVLISRWDNVAIAVLLVFVARFAFVLLKSRKTESATVSSSDQDNSLETASSLKMGLLNIASWFRPKFSVFLLIFALFFPFLPFTDRYLLDLSILVLTYIMLGWGLNIVVGLAGLLDLGYVAFYAVGAYSYALLSTVFFPWMVAQGYADPGIMSWVFWICLPFSSLLAALWGCMLGFPVLRLRGDYLAIVTLAFGEIIRVVLLNWHTFTGGPNGISRIPRPSFFGLDFNRGADGFAAFFNLEYSSSHRLVFFYYLILTFALITNLVTLRLRKLPVGRAWEALREDEIVCRSLGINTTNTKLTAFAIGAMFGGFAGAFFATRQGFISPESFVFMESALILAIVVLGGLGNQIGVVIAAIVMIGGIEAARKLEFLRSILGSDFDPSAYRMLVFGLAMVLIMIRWPRGLVSIRKPSILLKEKKSIPVHFVTEGKG